MTIVDGEIFSTLQVLSGVMVVIMLSCMRGAALPAVRDRAVHCTAMQRAGWEKRSGTRKVRHRPAERFANRLSNVPIRPSSWARSRGISRQVGADSPTHSSDVGHNKIVLDLGLKMVTEDQQACGERSTACRTSFRHLSSNYGQSEHAICQNTSPMRDPAQATTDLGPSRLAVSRERA